MDYTKHYYLMMEKAKIRNAERTELDYYEYHHIEPRCIRPDLVDDASNIVSLTAREHFVAHWLLTKIYRNHHISIRNKIASAFHKMCSDGQQGKRDKAIPSILYEIAKKEFSRNHPMKDKTIRKKVSDGLKMFYKNNPHYNKGRIKIPRETRICLNCAVEMTVLVNDKRKFCSRLCSDEHRKNNRDLQIYKDTRERQSKAMKAHLSSLPKSEIDRRMNLTFAKTNQEERGRKISASKKGKPTIQREFTCIKYASMSDHDFSLFIENKPENIKSRMTTYRKDIPTCRYCEENNIDDIVEHAVHEKCIYGLTRLLSQGIFVENQIKDILNGNDPR